MKTYIRELKELSLLKRNTKLKSGQYYLFQSESTGNTKYFERKEEMEYAKKTIRRHFTGVMEMVYEVYTSRGFLICVLVKSEKEVQEEWIEKGKLPTGTSRILSELIRYSISAITKFRNYINGRKGSVVRENFRTYEFKDKEGFDVVKEMIERGEIEFSGQEEGYRGGEGSEVGEVFILINEIIDYVLRKLKKNPSKTQNSPTPKFSINPPPL